MEEYSQWSQESFISLVLLEAIIVNVGAGRTTFDLTIFVLIIFMRHFVIIMKLLLIFGTTH